MATYYKSKPRSTSPPAPTDAKVLSSLPELIGGPPDTGSGIIPTGNLLRNSGLQIFIQPGVSAVAEGLSLFTIDTKEGWKKYVDLLEKVNFRPTTTQNDTHKISIVCQAESYPTDSFQNEYGESFLNQMVNLGANGIGDLAQIMGKTKGSEVIEEFTKMTGKLGKAAGGISGAMVGALSGLIEKFAKGAETWGETNKKEGGLLGVLAQTANALLAGGKVDFPHIWKGSSYSPTFSCTVKLYNPNPASDKSINDYIIAPLAALLTLALPQAPKPNMYNYPFFCKVECKGLFKINAGGISNITIVKGGDAGLIGFNQIVSMVDVKIDFVNLHSSMILSTDNTEERPTLLGYLKNMKDGMQLRPIYDFTTTPETLDHENDSSNNVTTTATDPHEQASARVDPTIAKKEDDIIYSDDSGFYEDTTASASYQV